MISSHSKFCMNKIVCTKTFQKQLQELKLGIHYLRKFLVHAVNKIVDVFLVDRCSIRLTSGDFAGHDKISLVYCFGKLWTTLVLCKRALLEIKSLLAEYGSTESQSRRVVSRCDTAFKKPSSETKWVLSSIPFTP